jgi:hypothetical protein
MIERIINELWRIFLAGILMTLVLKLLFGNGGDA